MQFCWLRSAVGCRDPHQDVFRAVFGILHEDVDVPILLEDIGVKQFIFRVVLGATTVRLHQIGMRNAVCGYL
jgi:hypothetical protein